MDQVTESEIMRTIKNYIYKESKTAIFIAHRLGTVADCDHIIVLKDGQVLEQGTHEYLLASKGYYADMWQVQSTKQK